MQEQTAMMKQIYSVGDLMESISGSLKEAGEKLFLKIDIMSYRKVILTGCGDSRCAAMAAKYFFSEYTDLEAEVVDVIELSRFYKKEQMKKDTLVIVISNSGHVARISELLKRMRQWDRCVIGVTGNRESELYQISNASFLYHLPSFVYAPGIRSYCVCLCALFEMALQAGERRGIVDKKRREVLDKEFQAVSMRIRGCLRLWEQETYEAAEKWRGAVSYELIASGYHYPNAWFGYAKALETTGKPVSAMNTEDWFHMNYFVRDVHRTASIIFINKDSPDHSRVRELILVAKEMERPVLCITDDEIGEGLHRILTPHPTEKIFHLFIQYLPVSMLFSHLGDLMGEVYFRDGKGHFTACVDCATLRNSEQIIYK